MQPLTGPVLHSKYSSKKWCNPHNPPPSPHTILLAYYGAHSGQEVQLFAFAAQVVAVWSVSTPCLWFHVPLFNCFDSLTNIKILIRFFHLRWFTLHTFSDVKAFLSRSFSYGLLFVADFQAKPATYISFYVLLMQPRWAVSTLRMMIRARQVGLL